VRAAALTAVVLAAFAVDAAAAGEPPWRDAYRHAARFEASRLGRVSFAIVDAGGVLHTFHGRRRYQSASLAKAMILVSYLNRGDVRRVALSSTERKLLGPMITRSDNGAASRVYAIVGPRGLAQLARRAHMTDFASSYKWGDTQMTAADQARFFYRIDKLVPPRHRAYALRLLARVIPEQRWGVADAVPRGARIYFKGGWRPSAGGWIVNQAALVQSGGRRVALAVLTDHDRDEHYGRVTIRGLARRLLAPL
jgi:beta-lactamase class A